MLLLWVFLPHSSPAASTLVYISVGNSRASRMMRVPGMLLGMLFDVGELADMHSPMRAVARTVVVPVFCQ